MAPPIEAGSDPSETAADDTSPDDPTADRTDAAVHASNETTAATHATTPDSCNSEGPGSGNSDNADQDSAEPDSADPDSAERGPVSFGLQSRDILPIVITAAGAFAVASRQQPTGNIAADVVLSFAFGAGLVWLSQFVTAQTLVISGVFALFFSGFQFPAVLIAAGAVGAASALTSWRTFDDDSERIVAAFSALLLSQAVLFLPNIRFVGTASLLATIALSPVLFQAYQNLPASHRQKAVRGAIALASFAVLATALAVFAALSARDGVETGIDLAERGVDALQAGDQPDALSLLESAENEFASASDRLGGALTWPARFVPIVAQHSRALETASDQGALLAKTAVRTVTRADVEAIRGQNGAIDLELVNAVNVELTQANLVLRQAQDSIRDVRTAWLLPLLDSRLESVQVELQDTAADIDLANQATAVVPRMLGSEGLRRYFVIFVQPAESREFGGFMGAYGMLEADQGQITLTESGSVFELGLNEAILTDPASLPEPYVRMFPAVNPQNLPAIADLSSIARASADILPQLRGDPSFSIDGVITIDPYALQAMLELTGPINVEGLERPLNSTNVADFLLRDQYLEFEVFEREERQDLLRVLAGEAFNRLLTVDIPGPERLGAVFGPVARANRIAVTTFNDDENAFLDRVLLSADFPRVNPTTDMLGIYTGSGTASKLDGYLTRSTTYTVDIDPETGSYTGTVELAATNGAPPDAGTYILGNRAIDGLNDEPLPIGWQILGLSVYAHTEITNMDSDTASIVRVTRPAFGYQRTLTAVEVPLGETANITFNTQGTSTPGRYELVVPPSQDANPGDFTLVVRPTPGWSVVTPGDIVDGVWTTSTSTNLANGFILEFERTG